MTATYQSKVNQLNANLRVCNYIRKGWRDDSYIIEAVDEWQEEIEKELKEVKMFNHTNARIIKLYNKGLTFEQIAQKLGHANMDRVLKVFFPDNCELCHGMRGGYKGNENVDDGVVICDYCSADRMLVQQKEEKHGK